MSLTSIVCSDVGADTAAGARVGRMLSSATQSHMLRAEIKRLSIAFRSFLPSPRAEP